MKKIISTFLTIALCLSFAVFPAAAETIEWDGTTKMTAGNTYVVTKDLTITKSFAIPTGAKLSVRDGATLTFRSDTLQVVVYGNLTVGNEGTLDLKRGELYISTDAVFDVYGKFNQYTNTKLNIKSTFTSYNTSEVMTSGTVNIYQTAKLTIKNSFILTNASITTITGSVTVAQSGTFRLEGLGQITTSGSLKSAGHVSVGQSGKIVNSGLVYLAANSSYNRFGELTSTPSGTFTDAREKSPYEELTVSILVDEPVVITRGIDVSYAQGDIDWRKVAESGVDFAIIRAARSGFGENPIKVDDFFYQNIDGATRNGIDVGVYFYSYATTVAQARQDAYFLLDAIKGYKITFPIILDMEEDIKSGGFSVSKTTEMIEAFFEVIMQHNYYPMLYSYKNWLNDNLDMRILDKYAIWLAEYKDEVTYQGGYYIWQYTSQGKVTGVDGNVDLNISYRDFPSILKKHQLNGLR